MITLAKHAYEAVDRFAERIETALEKRMNATEYDILKERLAEKHQRFYLNVADKEICVIIK